MDRTTAKNPSRLTTMCQHVPYHPRDPFTVIFRNQITHHKSCATENDVEVAGSGQTRDSALNAGRPADFHRGTGGRWAQ